MEPKVDQSHSVPYETFFLSYQKVPKVCIVPKIACYYSKETDLY